MDDKNKGRREFEDIYSSTPVETGEIFSSTSKKEHYYRSEKSKSKKAKERKRMKAFLITLISVLLVCTVGLTAALVLLNNFGYNHSDIDATNSDLGFDQAINKKIVNIALFGIDTRDIKSMKGNTDSIMILSLNTELKTVKIISVMRDSLVEIEKDGKKMYKKVNSAYAYGGPELAIKTLNKNFNLDISEYATVNFFGMAEIIDAVGGIEAELTAAETVGTATGLNALNDCIYGYCEQTGEDPTKYYITKPGKHHLNGVQAVAYSRIRHVANIWGTTDDYGRTERQRYVMEQLFEKAKTLPKTKYLNLIKALMPYTATSLGVDEVFKLAANVMLHSPSFEQSRIPLDEYKMVAPRPLPSVGSYVYFDRDYAADVLHAFIYDNTKPEDYMAQNPVRRNDWYAEVAG
jgi:LCP family protein required for cell wall assembly